MADEDRVKSVIAVSVKSAAALSLASVRPGFYSAFTWSFIINSDIVLLVSNIHTVLFSNVCKVRSR